MVNVANSKPTGRLKFLFLLPFSSSLLSPLLLFPSPSSPSPLPSYLTFLYILSHLILCFSLLSPFPALLSSFLPHPLLHLTFFPLSCSLSSSPYLLFKILLAFLIFNLALPSLIYFSVLIFNIS